MRKVRGVLQIADGELLKINNSSSDQNCLEVEIGACTIMNFIEKKNVNDEYYFISISYLL